jgi:tetratricopeptide (TPR) repeat protein
VSTPLRPIVRKTLLALICLGTMSGYVGRVVAVYLAQQAAYSSPPEGRVQGLERAIRLTPDDAEFPYLLGRWLSASDQDDNSAIVHLRKAAALNPNRGRYWLDLALVYQATGNVEKAKEAVQFALKAEPGNPEIAAEAGESFLVAGEEKSAFPLFRRALEQDPEAAKIIFQACWRETQDANLILAEATPANPELQLAFLGMLIGQDETTAANEVWQYIVGAHKPFPPQLSFHYFDYLLKQHDVARFDRAWHELADLVPAMQAYLPSDNLMVNAGFDQPLLNAGFDWRYEPADHIVVGVDDRVAHSGSHSLSLSYDGNPAYDAGWKQFVPVQPDTDYEFSAWIKSANVTTSSGPRISIADAFTDAGLLLTDDVLDTHPWQELKGTLRVPASTELLVVRITRAPANTRIRGRVWIDDLRLVKR